MGQAGLIIQIIDPSSGQVLATCRSGASCTASVPPPGGPGPHTYIARVVATDGGTIRAESRVIVVTWTSGPSATPTSPTPTPTATPTSPPPTPTPTGSLPVVKAGSWDVSYNRSGTSGDPPVDLGDHARRYELTPDCPSIDDCRIRAKTFQAGGGFIGNIVFTWRGDAYEYRGSANYYRAAGGTTCTTSGGDTVPNAYNVRELVRLQPDRVRGRRGR